MNTMCTLYISMWQKLEIFMLMDLLEPKILFYNQIDSKKLLPIFFYLLLLRGKQLENIT